MGEDPFIQCGNILIVMLLRQNIFTN